MKIPNASLLEWQNRRTERKKSFFFFWLFSMLQLNFSTHKIFTLNFDNTNASEKISTSCKNSPHIENQIHFWQNLPVYYNQTRSIGFHYLTYLFHFAYCLRAAIFLSFFLWHEKMCVARQMSNSQFQTRCWDVKCDRMDVKKFQTFELQRLLRIASDNWLFCSEDKINSKS